MYDEDTGSFPHEFMPVATKGPMPGLLVAHAPWASAKADTVYIEKSLIAGRAGECELEMWDSMLSRHHFTIENKGEECSITDPGSKNGTFVNSHRVLKEMILEDQDVIRAGETLMVFQKNVFDFMFYANKYRRMFNYGLAGGFHSALLRSELKECARSDRNVLIAGATGSGKELAAHAVAAMMDRPLTVQNAARYSNEEEATASLFGVGHRVFTDTDARRGFIERAGGGVLFLDEVHNLPRRVQKSLLRIMEDNELARIGETDSRPVDVRFVFASNEPGPGYGIEQDLLARLRVVNIPPLSKRKADIPDIFSHLLYCACEDAGINELKLVNAIGAFHYEVMMTDGFEENNVRGLVDIIDRIISKVRAGREEKRAIDDVFSAKYGVIFPAPLQEQRRERPVRKKPPSIGSRPTMDYGVPANSEDELYEQVRSASEKHGGNVAAIKRELDEKGIPRSRTRIARILDALKIRRTRKGRRKKRK